MGEARISEVKRHLDGRVERFDCALVLRRPHVIVVRYDFSRGRRISGVRVPAGSRSFGFFWRRRPYILYRIEGPDRRLIAHRFDVVEDVRFGEDEVSYRDLLLDLWIPSKGPPVIEDEDEVLAAGRSQIDREQNKRIERTRDLLLRRWSAIVSEAAGMAALDA